MDQPTNETSTIVGFFRDNVWSFFVALLTGGGIVQILQFFRLKRKDQAEARTSEVKVKRDVFELIDDMQTQHAETVAKQNAEIEALRKRVFDLEAQLQRYRLVMQHNGITIPQD